MSKAPFFSHPLFSAAGLVLCVSIGSLTVYHHFILRPTETVTVDFRQLSEAKLTQLVERTSTGGGPVSAQELQDFLTGLHASIADEARGRPVFVSGAVLNATSDLTPILAQRLGLALANNTNPTLPSMAERVQQEILRKPLTTEPTVEPSLEPTVRPLTDDAMLSPVSPR